MTIIHNPNNEIFEIENLSHTLLMPANWPFRRIWTWWRRRNTALLKSRMKCLIEAKPSVSREEEVIGQLKSVCSKINLQIPSKLTVRDIAFHCRMTPPFPRLKLLSSYPERRPSTKQFTRGCREKGHLEGLQLLISTGR